MPMDFKDEAFRKALEDLSKKRESTPDITDYLDMPGRATRAAIGAYQEDEPVVEAAMEQFSTDAPEAPTGFDIASEAGIENPYLGAAAATAADVLDPSMFIPGGGVGKLGMAAKALKKGDTAADALKAAAKSPYGKTVVRKTAQERMEEEMVRKGRERLRKKLQGL